MDVHATLSFLLEENPVDDTDIDNSVHATFTLDRVLIHTPAEEGVMVRGDRAEHVVGKIYGLVPIGLTLYKRDGVWYLRRGPGENHLAGADPILRGGYEHLITFDQYNELIAAGFEV